VAVAEDRHGVGHVEDLLEVVADEDHGHAVGAQLPHQVQQCRPLLLAEGSRRLVQQEQLRPCVQRPHDLQLLLLGDPERPGPRVRRDGHAQPLRQRPVGPGHRPTVRPPLGTTASRRP
jgi:hypothetical protein